MLPEKKAKVGAAVIESLTLMYVRRRRVANQNVLESYTRTTQQIKLFWVEEVSNVTLMMHHGHSTVH